MLTKMSAHHSKEEICKLNHGIAFIHMLLLIVWIYHIFQMNHLLLWYPLPSSSDLVELYGEFESKKSGWPHETNEAISLGMQAINGIHYRFKQRYS